MKLKKKNQDEAREEKLHTSIKRSKVLLYQEKWL